MGQVIFRYLSGPTSDDMSILNPTRFAGQCGLLIQFVLSRPACGTNAIREKVVRPMISLWRTG